MGTKEKFQGHEAERSTILHDQLKKYFQGEVVVEGKSQTKTDFLVGDIRISQKTVSGKNTQVWLPTQNTLFEHVPELMPIKDKIIQFLGTPAAAGLDPRDIPEWSLVIDLLNQTTKNKSLLNPMILRVGNEDPIHYISWVKKENAGKGFTLIDARLLVDYLAEFGEWKCSPVRANKISTLYLIDTKSGKKIIHLQRKGSGKGITKFSPLFHIHSNWPVGVIKSIDPLFYIPGI